MKGKAWLYGIAGLILSPLVSAQEAVSGADRELSVISDLAVGGFVHPESVAYDPSKGVLYVGQFGSVLQPTLKDGKGKISRISMQGKTLADPYLPAQGQAMDKPKGIWIQGGKLWVTDIDSVWVFDLESRQGKKASLPGAKFANDPVVIGDALFVSDTGGGRIYRVRPADWREGAAPEVTVWAEGLAFSPNGLFPTGDGSLLAVGYDLGGKKQGIYLLNPKGKVSVLAEGLGLLDGVAQMKDRRLLVTDWKAGALMQWSKTGGLKALVKGFGGPADFCVIPQGEGYLVVVPDLVKNEVRFIGLK